MASRCELCMASARLLVLRLTGLLFLRMMLARSLSGKLWWSLCGGTPGYSAIAHSGRLMGCWQRHNLCCPARKYPGVSSWVVEVVGWMDRDLISRLYSAGCGVTDVAYG